MIDADFLKSNKEILNQLMRIPALKSVDGEDLIDLLGASHIEKYHAGAVIFQEGSVGKKIFYLCSGKARIIKNGHVLMTLHRTGDVFGEMGPISGKARSASVEAVNDVSCIEIDLSVIDNKNRPDTHMFRYLIFRGYAEILAGRLRYTTEQMLLLQTELDQLKKTT